MNDVIKKTLQKAVLSSLLEPPGLDSGYESCPDGITVFPFSSGSSWAWECTGVDTFAGVLLKRSAMEVAQLQTAPRSANTLNTLHLQRHIVHQYEPITVETKGVYDW